MAKDYTPPPELQRPKSRTRVMEPHEYNAYLLKKQRERGEEPNIPQPSMQAAFKVTTRPPVMRDPETLSKKPGKKGKGALPLGDAGIDPTFDPTQDPA